MYTVCVYDAAACLFCFSRFHADGPGTNSIPRETDCVVSQCEKTDRNPLAEFRSRRLNRIPSACPPASYTQSTYTSELRPRGDATRFSCAPLSVQCYYIVLPLYCDIVLLRLLIPYALVFVALCPPCSRV